MIQVVEREEKLGRLLVLGLPIRVSGGKDGTGCLVVQLLTKGIQ